MSVSIFNRLHIRLYMWNLKRQKKITDFIIETWIPEIRIMVETRDKNNLPRFCRWILEKDGKTRVELLHIVSQGNKKE